MAYKLLFGTYTNDQSKGIYQATLNDNGHFSDLKLNTEIGSPTYLSKAQNSFIYSVERGDGIGGVAVIDNGRIVSHYLDEGSSPAYIGIDEQRQLVFVTNYHKGKLDIYKIADNMLELTDSFQNTGNGPREEQQSSHLHFSNLTPDNKLVNVDLGSDELIVFDLSNDGKLSNESRFKFDAGYGPRHIRFTKDGKFAVVIGELSSQVSLLSYQNGKFELLNTTSTIPEDFTDHNGGAAIRLSNDDKFVYASNRGYNSIAIFEIDYVKKELKLIDNQDVYGDFPRDFNITNDNKFLIVANQKTNNATSFSIDNNSGKLSLIEKDFYLPEAVRVTFDD
ncbi:MAG: lactonase family protein [Lactobacillaceae bacterium]|jgi:6-phosphogluconolactonase|nr:lactonase family protein [Lactobacillaceae bacterium]